MFFPALAMLTSVWMITAPLMDVETGPLAVLSMVVGCIAWLLASLGYWSQAAHRALAVVGVFLGMATFVLSGSVMTQAACAVSAVVLIMTGIAARPAKMLARGPARRVVPAALH